MDPVSLLVGSAIGLVLGSLVGIVGLTVVQKGRLKGATSEAGRLMDEAKRDADRIRQEAEVNAKDEALKRRQELEDEANEARKEHRDHEKRIRKREDQLEHKMEVLEKKEHYLEKQEEKLLERQAAVQERDDELELLLEEQQERLSKVAGMSREAARDLLIEQVKENIAQEEQAMLNRMVDRVKSAADEKAHWAISQAIHRVASEHTTEYSTSSIDLPSDDMKGRIIGREGRNIRAFEKATGVDVIVDDTPGIVVVSAFDSVRREIARRALEKLVADGRIHPARIEEIVAATKKDVEKMIEERGKQVQFETDIHGIHPKIQYLLGRLQFRTSYGQNVLLHSIECAHIAGIMAAELNIDVKMAKRAALLHDVGKALDHDQEGGHPLIGMEFAAKYKEPPEVLDAIGFHHDTENAKTIYAILASAADAISASRPGARRETLERYIKRLEKLEEVATSFDGVDHAYAVQAGREIRVIVDDAKVSDEKASQIARDLACQIEDELTYPGEIRVTLIREHRVVEYAR